ncbi:hypothetical protein FHR81_000033 [Actinoalloteichus hoggarensis]|uniref:Uncharacterized protein n=1 Tax=Actinoalloteichus hoggarensis TaxID=1470176 RepID=A0A221W368_9PSEU|nr:hypothetical protein [Actinoalloteichus hoggarensis]ASO20282.1 hypothetical protein AHOG_13195 [Actinoalloteichus hoggarensis]MBB5919004.1 hypothetical protein [Actinoalloteichus hoggarensis]
MDRSSTRHRIVTALVSAAFMTVVFALFAMPAGIPLTGLPLTYLAFFGLWALVAWAATPLFERFDAFAAEKRHRLGGHGSGEG